MPQFELAQAGTEQKVREQIIALLPRLSAFAYCLTGNTEQPDDLVEETCARALANMDQWQPGMHLSSWVFRIAQNLWFNRQRAKKFRSEPRGSEVADHLVGRGGRAVTENQLALADFLRALDRLSPQHRVLIALVSACGLTYTQAAEILNLPLETVLRRLARGRLALHDAVDEAIASKATRH